MNAISMSTFLHFLRVEFGIATERLVEFAPDAHNVHFLAAADEDTYHVTLRDLAYTADRPDEIERILAWTTHLPGPTGCIVRTYLRSRAGYCLAEYEGLYVSVRKHRGHTCDQSTPVAAVVEAAMEHGRAIDAIALLIEIDRPGLRYRAFTESIDLIRGRLTTFVRLHAAQDELEALLAVCDSIARRPAGNVRARLVHGDLSFMNLIDVEGSIAVIDHDCLHADHPLYDHAHLLVSLASSNYFHGAFSLEKAESYVTHWCDLNSHDEREALLGACEYVVLKKLALVRQPKNLHVADRLHALNTLRMLR